MEPQLVTYHDPEMDIQQPFDVAVVIPTILRTSLIDAVRSIYTQDLEGKIQILLGIDTVDNDDFDWDSLLAERPSHIAVTLFWPGYSTSAHRGGTHSAYSAGSMRSLLSFLANSRYIAYLDDDNWYSPDHLSSLKETLSDNAWAYSRRWFVDGKTKTPICEDSWESVGPDKGVFTSNFGGFVDTNCYMIDVLACAPHITAWAQAWKKESRGRGCDRNFFNRLKASKSFLDTKKPTVSYVISETDTNHQARYDFIDQNKIPTGQEACINWVGIPKKLETRPNTDESGRLHLYGDHTKPFDIAVIIPTICRIQLLKALNSIKAQNFKGRIQILIGIDSVIGDKRILEALGNNLPDNMGLMIIDPGYSTSQRHGGVHASFDGGALRTILSLLAHAPYIAYLDDDNSWISPLSLLPVKMAGRQKSRMASVPT
jgi:glycosyltransferase involved in cell wall biosynthesis